MSKPSKKENSSAVKARKPDDQSIEKEKNIKPQVEILVDEGGTSQIKTLNEALDTIRDTILESSSSSSSSPYSKSTTIAIKHCFTEFITIDMPRSPNRSQVIQTPSGSTREIPDDRSGSTRDIPVDRPKSGRKKESSDKRSDSDQKKKNRPSDKQKKPVEEEPDSAQMVNSTKTSPGYEWDVDMCSVGTGPEPDELEDLIEDMQID